MFRIKINSSEDEGKKQRKSKFDFSSTKKTVSNGIFRSLAFSFQTFFIILLLLQDLNQLLVSLN